MIIFSESKWKLNGKIMKVNESKWKVNEKIMKLNEFVTLTLGTFTEREKSGRKRKKN